MIRNLETCMPPPHLCVSIAYMCTCLRVCTHVEVRCLWHMSSSITLHLMFSEIRVFHWTWGSSIQLDWLPRKPQGSPCLCLSSAGVTDAWHQAFFFFNLGTEDPNSSSHVFVALPTLPTGPSPLVCLLIQDSATGMDSNKIMNSHQTSVDREIFHYVVCEQQWLKISLTTGLCTGWWAVQVTTGLHMDGFRKTFKARHDGLVTPVLGKLRPEWVM